MKKVLCFIGSALYALVLSYLMWLLFYWLTPWLLSLRWYGIIIYWLVASFVAGIIISFIGVISIPLYKMCVNTACKILPTLFVAFNGYSTVALPWHAHPHGAGPIIMSLSIDCFALAFFISLIVALWKFDTDKGKDDTYEE